MSRVQIDLPSKFIFSTNIPIRVDDINVVHLGYQSILTFLSETRLRYLRTLGYIHEGEIDGAGIIVADVAIVYLNQGHYGQTLKVDIALNDFTSKGFDILYRISDAETGVEIARAKTGLLLFDYKLQKVTTIPPVFRKKLLN